MTVSLDPTIGNYPDGAKFNLFELKQMLGQDIKRLIIQVDQTQIRLDKVSHEESADKHGQAKMILLLQGSLKNYLLMLDQRNKALKMVESQIKAYQKISDEEQGERFPED